MTRLWTKSLLAASIGLSAVIWTATGFGQLPAVPAIPAVPAVPAVDPAPAVEPVRNAVRGAAQDARDTVRGAAQDARDAVRGAAQDARDAVRGAAQDVRDTVRDARVGVNASANARANLRWQDMRAADLGLWFNSSANANNGLVIADVATQGPIAKLGFQEGDQIVSVGGRAITRQADFLPFLYSANAAGGRVPIIISRGGQQQTIYMEPQAFLTHANSYQSDPLEPIGIVADDRVEGKAVVWRVMPRSAAFYAGLRNGDIVTSFNSQPVSTAAELSQLAAKAKAGPIALEVQRGDKTRQLQVDLQAPNAEVRSALRPNLDSDTPTPALNAGIRTAPASGYYNGTGRRGLFRGRR